jgi:hypothetical protein
MQFSLVAFFVSTAAAAALESSTNCNGAWACDSGASNAIAQIQTQVQQIINQTGSDQPIGGGQIACAPMGTGLYDGSICAFYQDGASGTAQEVYNELGQLLQYGCTICGSTATSPGILTVNYVSKACCSGECVCWNTIYGDAQN